MVEDVSSVRRAFSLTYVLTYGKTYGGPYALAYVRVVWLPPVVLLVSVVASWGVGRAFFLLSSPARSACARLWLRSRKRGINSEKAPRILNCSPLVGLRNQLPTTSGEHFL